MKTLITGSHGLVGTALSAALRAGGDEPIPLTRSATASGPSWDPAAGRLEAGDLEGLGAVVHLAGEGIASGRWNAARKERIRSSRVDGTRLLAARLAGLTDRPKVLVAASAIGYYGDRGDEILREDSAPGDGFLSDVCRAWEAATAPASDAGIRVVSLRFGVILSASGGALAKMLTPFRMGAGGVLGDGRQYMSWIALDDAVGAVRHALRTEDLRGPVNAVAPAPVSNRDFTRSLGRALSRPTVFPMPAFAARLVFGEMADALLLASTRVEPARLMATGYRFLHPELDGALRHVLR